MGNSPCCIIVKFEFPSFKNVTVINLFSLMINRKQKLILSRCDKASISKKIFYSFFCQHQDRLNTFLSIILNILYTTRYITVMNIKFNVTIISMINICLIKTKSLKSLEKKTVIFILINNNIKCNYILKKIVLVINVSNQHVFQIFLNYIA